MFRKAMLTIYDKDFGEKEECSSEGLLIGVVDSKKWLIFDNLYALSEEERGNKITIKSMHDLKDICELSIEHRYTRRDFARACGHPIDGRIAVVFRHTTWLDVFNASGN